MSRYGETSTIRECVESQKDLKQRIKTRKKIFNDFIEMSKFIEMDWKEKNATIGYLYMEIKNMKSTLKGSNKKHHEKA